MAQDENVWAAPHEQDPGPAGSEPRPPASPYAPPADPPSPPPGAPLQPAGVGHLPPPLAAPAGRRTLPPAWAIVLIVIVCLFMGMLGLAAAYSRARDAAGTEVWEATHYVFPDRIDGMTHADTDATRQWAKAVKQELDKWAIVYDVQATSYGDPAKPSVLVLTARPDRALNKHVQQLIEASNAGGRKPGEIATARDPGPLGGTLTCGTSDAALICSVVDEAGQMVIAMPAATGSDAEARGVRAVVEIPHAPSG